MSVTKIEFDGWTVNKPKEETNLTLEEGEEVEADWTVPSHWFCDEGAPIRSALTKGP